MHQRILAAELAQIPIGSEVTLAGWIHRRRQLSGVSFLVLRDRSGLAQIVAKAPHARAAIGTLGEESVVQVRGRLAANDAAPGGLEVIEPRIEPPTEPSLTPPVELWRPAQSEGLPTRLDHAAAALRHPRSRARWQLAAASLHGFRSSLDSEGFTEVSTPKVVGMATESGANVFQLDYFGRPAYLAQSPQLYKQMLVGVFERVFEVGPVFRAEPHDTVRHLAQYTSLDVEFGFIESHRDVIAMFRTVLAGMLSSVRERAADAVELLGVDVPQVPEALPVIHFREALRLVGAAPDEPDLEPAHERALGVWAKETHGSDFLVVEGYPMAKRPFYTHPQPDDPRWSNSFDVLFRGLELSTGGQRLHRPADYRAALATSGQSAEEFSAYLEAFDHGMPPHGGFAIGLERWVARLTGAANVREVTLFPRDLHRLAP
ncbi:aspartate--tRNA(Asn) ligase [Flexivirga meconopsidis]|uniref:aspartate--tRNA(Asn) ligase n=1 Tax=Flexivirga meconopsidis TaxID=2977121 RepID=UPI00223F36C9|nr:aspartate--tRNA(Asn) ligase [Flexivirga meconopsidis]